MSGKGLLASTAWQETTHRVDACWPCSLSLPYESGIAAVGLILYPEIGACICV